MTFTITKNKVRIADYHYKRQTEVASKTKKALIAFYKGLYPNDTIELVQHR